MIAGVVVGRLGGDAETRDAGGTPVVSFNIASDEYQGKGKDKLTTWVRVSYFGTRATAVASYLTKGKQIAVRGSLSLRPYESKGEKRVSLEMRADEVQLLGSKDDAGGSSGGGGGGSGGGYSGGSRSTGGGGGGGSSQTSLPDEGPEGDDIPFAVCETGATERWWKCA
jgi:single-strand DNA-binding protein